MYKRQEISHAHAAQFQNPSVLNLRLDGANRSAYLNGTQTINIEDSGTIVSSNYPFCIGGGDNGDKMGDFYFSEFIIYQKALTPEAREEIEAHLAHKWGLAGNLPTSHPYKSVSPIDLNASRHNHLFTLEENGTLRTAGELNYEQANALNILVEAKDEYNASVQRSFTINVLNDPGSVFTVSGGGFEAPYFQITDGNGQTPDFTTRKMAPGNIYEFTAQGISSSHPFMIGESYGDMDSACLLYTSPSPRD